MTSPSPQPSSKCWSDATGPGPRTRRDGLLRAEAAAADVLRTSGIDGLPVDVDAIAGRLGIAVVAAPIRGFGAGLFRLGESYGILVSERASDATRRFSIAHELGHFLIDGHPHAATRLTGGTALPSSDKGLEREAERFATALLMPVDACRSLMSGRRVDAAFIAAFARSARVPLTAAALRMCELADDALTVLLTEGGRVRAAFHSRPAGRTGPVWRSLVGAPVPPRSKEDGMRWGRHIVGMREEVIQTGGSSFLTILRSG